MATRVPTGRYSGPADLLVDGDKLADVTIELFGSQRLAGGSSLAGPEAPVSGTQRWDGRIVAGADLSDLYVETVGKTFTLCTPDGRETTAFLRDDRGTLAASSPFPFN